MDVGQRLAVPLRELRLGIEEIELAGAALHEHEDDVLRLGGKWRGLGRERIRAAAVAAQAFLLQQIGERDGADAARAVAEEVAAGLDLLERYCSSVHDAYSRVMNSSRFSRTRLMPDPGGSPAVVVLVSKSSKPVAFLRGGLAVQAEL